MVTHLCPACSAALPNRDSERCAGCGAILRLGERLLLPHAVIKLAEQVAATGCSWDAFEFVLRGIPPVRAKLHGSAQVNASSNAHLLCWGLMDHARHRFGADAADVLESFGLRTSHEIGKVIFGLVSIGFLQAEESDRPEDFKAVLEIRAALSCTKGTSGQPWAGKNH